MQAVLNNPSALNHFRFAGGRNYMMRSEKRSGSGPAHHSPASGGRPPRRRRRRAGFFYKLFMLLLLLTVWPLGLLMLWRRKVRWGIPTKLLTSVVTLAACIILIGFALTVNTGNAQYTAVQDSVNGFLDAAADTLIETGGIVADHATEMVEGMEDMADALWESNKIHLANGIDAGVSLTQRAKNGVLELIEKVKTTSEPTAEATDAPSPLPEDADTSAAPTDAESSAENDESSLFPAVPESTPDEAGAAPLSEPSSESTNTPDAELTEESTDTPTAEPIKESTDASTAEPIEESTDAPSNDAAEATATSTNAPTQAPTPEPTVYPVVPSVTLKPAAQATVYHSTNGQWYHSFNRCSGMTGGGAYTLEECAATLKRCRACGAADPALIGQPCLWMDEFKKCHTSDECSAFEGKYTLILRDEALAQGLVGCDKCGGSEYLLANTTIDYDAQSSAQSATE